MKRLWIACGIMAVLFLATLGNAFYLERFTGQLSELLAQAEQKAEEQAWQNAAELTQQAYDSWEAHGVYLHITLRHADTDEVLSSFQEVLELTQCEEAGEYSAANAHLMTQLSLICEAERPSLKNIL